MGSSKIVLPSEFECINSPSSAAGPERWLEEDPSTRSVPIYNHSEESSPEMVTVKRSIQRLML